MDCIIERVMKSLEFLSYGNSVKKKNSTTWNWLEKNANTFVTNRLIKLNCLFYLKFLKQPIYYIHHVIFISVLLYR